MKSKTIFFAFIMLTVSHLAHANWQIRFDSEANRVLHMGGDTLRGNFATKEQCQAYQRSRPAFEQNHSTCVECGGSSSGSTGYSGGSPQQQIQMMFFQSLFDSLFASPPDTSAQDEIARQNAIKQQQVAEQAKQAAIQAWIDLQNKEDLQRKIAQEAKIEQGKKMLSQMQTVGGSGKLEPFSFGNPKLDLKPLSQKTYPNTKLTTWERLLCSAYFSNLAKQSTKDVDARFYSDQAQRVTIGEPTYLECRIPQVSNEKLAKRMKEVKKVYDEMNVKMNDLQDIEYKISESKERIEKAELKKEEATTKLNELQNRAVSAKPEEIDEMEALIAAAKKERQDAEQELNQAKESERDDLAKKEQLEKELENMKSQMQAKMQAGGE